MKEILFRGKSIHDNTWYHGFPISIDLETYSQVEKEKYKYCIVPPNVEFYRCELGSVEFVLPETISQYVGLKDTDGTKIFEGDVLESPVKSIGQKYGNLIIITDIRECKFAALYVSGYRVIGNVYDNPEFLEMYDTKRGTCNGRE